MAARVAEKAGLKTDRNFPPGLDYFFPNAPELLKLQLNELGITRTRQSTIKTATQAIFNKDVKLTAFQPFDHFHRDFSALKGIGDWTVNYVAMRGLGMIDSFPANDLGIIKALAEDGKALSKNKITLIAEDWRPYRSYATLCLWNYEK